jgi:hypothetical protein
MLFMRASDAVFFMRMLVQRIISKVSVGHGTHGEQSIVLRSDCKLACGAWVVSKFPQLIPIHLKEEGTYRLFLPFSSLTDNDTSTTSFAVFEFTV